MLGKLLHLVLCVFLTYVLNAVCLDENFDYWYSSDDGLVPGHYKSQRAENDTSKRYASDDDGLTYRILRKIYTNDHQIVQDGLNKGPHCTNMLCLIKCFGSGKYTTGGCKDNRCVCNFEYRKQSIDDNY